MKYLWYQAFTSAIRYGWDSEFIRMIDVNKVYMNWDYYHIKSVGCC